MKLKMRLICFVSSIALLASICFGEHGQGKMVIFDFDTQVPAALNFDSSTSDWFSGPRYTVPTSYGVAPGGRSGNSMQMVLPYTDIGWARENRLTCYMPLRDFSRANSLYVWVKSDNAESSLWTTPYLSGGGISYVWGEGGIYDCGWWYAPNILAEITDVWTKIENDITEMFQFQWDDLVTCLPAPLTAVDSVVLEFTMPLSGPLIDWGTGYADPGPMGPETIMWDDIGVSGYWLEVSTEPTVFGFEEDEEEWVSGGAEGMFSLPSSLYTSGTLAIQSVDANTFGYWESSHDEIPYVADSIYRVTFKIAGSAEPVLAPSFRLRINTQSSTTIGALVVDSWGDGEESPGATAKDYILYFDPLDQSTYQESEETDDLYVAFDLLSFNPDDDVTATFYIDSVIIDRFDRTDVEGTTVKVYDTTEDFDNWDFAGATGYFTMPLSNVGEGSLTLTADNNSTDTFGFWESSRTANEIDIDPGLLYRALFTVSSTSVLSDNPQARLRLGTESNKMTSVYVTYSNLDAINSARATGTEYQVFLYPPQSDVDGPEDTNGLIVAIDMLNFTEADDPNGDLTLERVEIQTINPATLP